MSTNSLETDAIKVLLVEDSTLDARMVERYLESGRGAYFSEQEFDLTWVSSQAAAFEALQSYSFDIILLDLGLEDSRGVEGVTALCNHSPHLPIVVLTGLDDNGVQLEAIRLGAADYLLKKDLSVTELRRCILYTIQRQKVFKAFQFAERQLQEADRMDSLNGLAAGIAHEVNTPVQYLETNLSYLQNGVARWHSHYERIVGLIHQLAEEYPQSSLVLSILELISDQKNNRFLNEFPVVIKQSFEGIAHISSTVSSMLEFSHPGGKDKVFSDINSILRNVSVMTKGNWKQICTLQIKANPSMPLVPIYPPEISQVILNLVGNAIDAICMKEGRGSHSEESIELECTVENGNAVIRVSDTGPGIPNALVGRIFDPFFTSKDVGEGTGLGLAVARHIVVNRHGGEITFESRPGQGTRFTVTLPIQSVEEEDNTDAYLTRR